MRPIFVVLVVGLTAVVIAQQKGRRTNISMTTGFKQKKSTGLELPNNATSIRENIVDTFSCENRIYGYYADIDNECQIFHICFPQIRNSIRFSFICPAETVFNQATFVCTRTESSIPCEESEKYYGLNEAFGKVDENTDESVTDPQGNEIEETTSPAGVSQRPTRPPLQHIPTTYRPTRTTTFANDYEQTVRNAQRPVRPTQPKKHIRL